jgi:hypothetical protein
MQMSRQETFKENTRTMFSMLSENRMKGLQMDGKFLGEEQIKHTEMAEALSRLAGSFDRLVNEIEVLERRLNDVMKPPVPSAVNHSNREQSAPLINTIYDMSEKIDIVSDRVGTITLRLVL